MAKNAGVFDYSDALHEAEFRGEERGRKEARASHAARTRAKTTEHKRITERESQRQKSQQARARAEGRRQKSMLERERERSRAKTTAESQRTAREYQRERARQQRDAAQARERRRSRRSGGGGSGGPSVPQVGTSGVEMSKATGRNIVLACIVGSALAVSFRSSKSSGGLPQAIQLKSGQQVRVPANLRSLGGVLLAGTAALILTEINTPLGVTFGVLLLLDSGFGNALGSFTSSFFNGSKPVPYLPGNTPTGIAGGNETFDPKTGLLHGDRGTFRLVPVGNGNYSVEPVPDPTQPPKKGNPAYGGAVA